MKLVKPFTYGLHGDTEDVGILLNISDDLKEKIHARIHVAQAIPGERFDHVAFRDYTLTILKDFSPGILSEKEKHQFYDHEFVDIEKPVGSDQTLSADYEHMLVGRDGCYWEFRPKYSYSIYHTPKIKKEDL